MSRLLITALVVALISGALAAACVAAVIDHGFLHHPPFEERAGMVLLWTPYLAIAVGPVVAGIALALHALRLEWAAPIAAAPWLSATLFLVATVVLLGPVAGFHHMFRFGVLGYAVLDCESRTDLGRCEVHTSGLSMVVSVFAWLGLLAAVHRLRRGAPAK